METHASASQMSSAMRGEHGRDGGMLGTRADLRGKGAGKGASPGSSRSSLSTSTDEQVNTHMSASSAGATLSSEGGSARYSTARTSAMADDLGATTSPSPHAHPTLTVLELTSNTASSSALPDSFGFNVSRQGGFVAVYTASNIWLIKTAQLPRLWARTLEMKRKPVAIDICEHGSLLAVLSRPSQVDLYELQAEPTRQIKKRRTIMLVHEASSMVVSPDGLILIAGNKFGIEVVSIGPDAPESCRRTLSGPVGNSLQFSDDGRTLLITGYARNNGTSSLFVLPGLYDGPLDEEGVPIPASPEAAWTGLVLFPETTKIARQATLLPDAETGHIDELFAFNADEDTWGIYDIPSQRFTKRKMFLPDQQRWTRAEFLDDAMPAVSPNADLAAVALRMRGTTSIWIYQVPDWDLKSKSSGSEHSPIQPCFCIPVLYDTPDINQEICELRWVKIDDNVQRLVAVGNISTNSPESDRASVPEGSSKGVCIFLDFDRTKPVGGPVPEPTKTEYDLDPLLPGERLPEGSIDFDREVELVRTRTLAQRRAQNQAVERRRNSSVSAVPSRARTTANRERPISMRPNVPTITREDSADDLTMEEGQAAFEAPYDNTQPRSQTSLARAATVAAVSPANRRHLRALPFRPLEYRRADGLRELPHESDADNWVPPPPAYTTTAEASQSVSLSHPDAPPVPPLSNPIPRLSIRPSHLRSSTTNPAEPVPANPYRHRGSFQSVSSTDLSLPAPHTRHTYLLHSSTFPAPPNPIPGRRRSSATRPPNAVLQGPQQEQSAYRASRNYTSTRRANARIRRAVESGVDLRPPPLIGAATGRRGSAPDAILHRRPAPNVSPPANRISTPHGVVSGRSHPRRAMLPRLSTHLGPTTAPSARSGTLSAPPRTNTGARLRAQSSPDMQTSAREKPAKRRIGCVVM